MQSILRTFCDITSSGFIGHFWKKYGASSKKVINLLNPILPLVIFIILIIFSIHPSHMVIPRQIVTARLWYCIYKWTFDIQFDLKLHMELGVAGLVAGLLATQKRVLFWFLFMKRNKWRFVTNNEISTKYDFSAIIGNNSRLIIMNKIKNQKWHK